MTIQQFSQNIKEQFASSSLPALLVDKELIYTRKLNQPILKTTKIVHDKTLTEINNNLTLPLPQTPRNQSVIKLFTEKDIADPIAYKGYCLEITKGKEFKSDITTLHKKNINGTGTNILIVEKKSRHQTMGIATLSTIAPKTAIYTADIDDIIYSTSTSSYDIESIVRDTAVMQCVLWTKLIAEAKSKNIQIISSATDTDCALITFKLIQAYTLILFGKGSIKEKEVVANMLAKITNLKPEQIWHLSAEKGLMSKFMTRFMDYVERFLQQDEESQLNFKKLNRMISDSGILFVAASGNIADKSIKPSLSYPLVSRFVPNVLTVGQTDLNGNASKHSVIGPQVDVIQEAAHANGTSFSAPYAASIAALMLQQNPKLSRIDIERIFQQTGNKTSTVPDINPAKAVAAAQH
jgi:hypothetical protein